MTRFLRLAVVVCGMAAVVVLSVAPLARIAWVFFPYATSAVLAVTLLLIWISALIVMGIRLASSISAWRRPQ